MEDEKYECRAHSKTRLRYHIIFSTKYRRKCLNDIREDVLRSFDEAQKNVGVKILCMELDSDHIHLLVKFPPSLSISRVVQGLKYWTTKLIYERDRDYLKRFYWKRDEIWTGGYFCSTIGDVSEKTLKKYIENQG